MEPEPASISDVTWIRMPYFDRTTQRPYNRSVSCQTPEWMDAMDAEGSDADYSDVEFDFELYYERSASGLNNERPEPETSDASRLVPFEQQAQLQPLRGTPNRRGPQPHRPAELHVTCIFGIVLILSWWALLSFALSDDPKPNRNWFCKGVRIFIHYYYLLSVELVLAKDFKIIHSINDSINS